jgi:hypothetical protein
MATSYSDTIVAPETNQSIRIGISGPPAAVRPAHACRWCGEHDCPCYGDHERLLASGETYSRMTPVQRNTCPACQGDVRDGRACLPTPLAVAS